MSERMKPTDGTQETTKIGGALSESSKDRRQRFLKLYNEGNSSSKIATAEGGVSPGRVRQLIVKARNDLVKTNTDKQNSAANALSLTGQLAAKPS